MDTAKNLDAEAARIVDELRKSTVPYPICHDAAELIVALQAELKIARAVNANLNPRGVRYVFETGGAVPVKQD